MNSEEELENLREFQGANQDEFWEEHKRGIKGEEYVGDSEIVPIGKIFPYFAYGSNIDKRKMRKITGKFGEFFPAVLKGYKLKFNKVAKAGNGEGYANIIKDSNETVEGVVYFISMLSLKRLEKWEGCPEHYERTIVEIEKKASNEKLKVWTFIANQNKVEDNLKPKREYLQCLLNGKEFLSSEYYKKLLSVETLD